MINKNRPFLIVKVKKGQDLPVHAIKPKMGMMKRIIRESLTQNFNKICENFVDYIVQSTIALNSGMYQFKSQFLPWPQHCSL